MAQAKVLLASTWVGEAAATCQKRAVPLQVPDWPNPRGTGRSGAGYPHLSPSQKQKHAERYQRVLIKLAALSTAISQVTLVVPASAPTHLEVRLGDRAIAPNEWGVALPVDPGTDTITASLPGRTPWRTKLAVQRGKRARVEVALPAQESGDAAKMKLPADEPAIPWYWVTGG